ncbi:hypothetical protein CMI38_02125 [Candidatus Pacearchaeota archaeon]|jgi:hypothetical protein|nr:hypothetical protein [Candidatus Pacearchaeota archaeon]|tara:strand:+ start:1393 stop:1701 length:309 start_codon:yes stop_codon:yes gene_type:complete
MKEIRDKHAQEDKPMYSEMVRKMYPELATGRLGVTVSTLSMDHLVDLVFGFPLKDVVSSYGNKQISQLPKTPTETRSFEDIVAGDRKRQYDLNTTRSIDVHY